MKKITVLVVLLLGMSLLYAAQPRSVYFPVTVGGETITEGEAAGITAAYWITTRPGEVATQYIWIAAAFNGSAMVDLQYFDTPWAIGDTLHVELTFDGETGIGEVVIPDLSGGPLFPPDTPTIDIPAAGGAEPIDWGDGVTGEVEGGTPSNPGMGYGTGLPNEDLIIQEDNAGYYFTLTIDDADLPIDVTFTLDHAALDYIPYNIAYWFDAAWHYIPAEGTGNLNDGTAPDWTDPGTATASVTFTISAKKGPKAPVDVYIVSADGPDPVDDLTPVTLAEFAAVQHAKFAKIRWASASETNMSCYNIYRNETDDFSNAMHITEEIAQDQAASYEFIDENVEVGNTYYYWLQGVNNNGTSELWGSIEITINEEVPEQPSQLTELQTNYPNPFNPVTYIKYQVKEGETGTLTIYNAKGQRVERAQLNETMGVQTYEWDGTKYGSGIYFYRLETNSYSEVKKMIMLK